jgi:hypothetical protein
MAVQIKLSAEGETWVEYPDGWSVQTEAETRVREIRNDGHHTDHRLDADKLLSQVAALVPEGTRLRVTVETV